jgi:16S rRNA (guanine527-N7)-methyltransferase
MAQDFMLNARLNQLLIEAGSAPLDENASSQMNAYLAVLQKWNARTNLTAIRDEESILRRHFVESILCARALPTGIATLLDFGSGAGFPGLPIAILRPEITVTLAESQNKKAAFLREAIRTLGMTAGITVKVHGARAETLLSKFDCITLRAVDNMSAAIPAAITLLAPQGWLAILTTITDKENLKSLAGLNEFQWQAPCPIPTSSNCVLLLGQAIPHSTH